MATALERCEAAPPHRWDGCPNNPDQWPPADIEQLERQQHDDRAHDWTATSGGASNTSPEFARLVGEVDRLIRQSGHTLLAANGTRTVAGLIMAQLAHVHGLAPRPEHRTRP